MGTRWLRSPKPRHLEALRSQHALLGGCNTDLTDDAYAAVMDRQKEVVLRTLEERDIRFVRLWFTDVLGYLKSVAIAPAELEGAFEEGIGFDGSSIEGFARVSESDTVAHPDPSTFQVLPWATSSGHHH